MRRPRRTRTLALALAALVVFLAAGPEPSGAQQPVSSAELMRVAGRVEVLRKGQTQWLPAVVGARLVEGDDIRVFSGASAELAFPDGSTVQLAENSRLLLTRVEFDQQNQSRLVLLHLVVGKVRAAIAQASMTLVRARQSNFAISTPTAVAAARGTVLWILTIPPTATTPSYTYMAVEPEPGVRVRSRIECITLGGTQTTTKRVLVTEGGYTTDCNPQIPIPPQFLTLSNPATAGFDLGAPVTAPPTGLVLQLVQGPAPGTVSISDFNLTGNTAVIGNQFPTSFGRDQGVNQIINQQTTNCLTPTAC